jgi:hypothetical protein
MYIQGWTILTNSKIVIKFKTFTTAILVIMLESCLIEIWWVIKIKALVEYFVKFIRYLVEYTYLEIEGKDSDSDTSNISGDSLVWDNDDFRMRGLNERIKELDKEQ